MPRSRRDYVEQRALARARRASLCKRVKNADKSVSKQRRIVLAYGAGCTRGARMQSRYGMWTATRWLTARTAAQGVVSACPGCHTRHKGLPPSQSKFIADARMGCVHDKTDTSRILILHTKPAGAAASGGMLRANGKSARSLWVISRRRTVISELNLLPRTLFRDHEPWQMNVHLSSRPPLRTQDVQAHRASVHPRLTGCGLCPVTRVDYVRWQNSSRAHRKRRHSSRIELP